MNRSTLAALVVALMLGSGVAGYLIGRPADRVDMHHPEPPPSHGNRHRPLPRRRPRLPRRPRRVAAPTAAALPPAPTSTRARSRCRSPPRRRTSPSPIAASALDTSRAEGEACLAFNKPLATSNVNYADYVAITPEAKTGPARDRRPALRQRARPTARTTRSACARASRAATASSSPRRRTSTWRWAPVPAVVTLPGKGFILPRGSAAGLPITTINVSKVGLAVYRVNERAIDGLRPRPLRRRTFPRQPADHRDRSRSTAG